MANEENLIPAQKGEVRNPRGKAKGTIHRSTIIRALLEQKAKTPEEVRKALDRYFPNLPKKLTVGHLVYYAQLVKAITQRDTRAAEFVMDSAYGKSQENIGPIKQVLEVVWKGGNGRDDNNTDDNVKLTETDPDTG